MHLINDAAILLGRHYFYASTTRTRNSYNGRKR